MCLHYGLRYNHWNASCEEEAEGNFQGFSGTEDTRTVASVFALSRVKSVYYG